MNNLDDFMKHGEYEEIKEINKAELVLKLFDLIDNTVIRCFPEFRGKEKKKIVFVLRVEENPRHNVLTVKITESSAEVIIHIQEEEPKRYEIDKYKLENKKFVDEMLYYAEETYNYWAKKAKNKKV